MKFYILVFALCFINVLYGQTVTVTFNADKDNTIYSDNTGRSNGAGENFFAGRNDNGALRRALLHFDLSSLPPTTTITAVTLHLWNNKQANNSAGIIIHRATADWGEGTSNAGGQEGGGVAATTDDATWVSRFHPSTPWSTAGGDYVATPSMTIANITSGANAISGGNLVADVQRMVDTPSVNFGWLIRGSAENSNTTSLRFGSRTNPTATQRPTLTVTYQTSLPVVLKSFTGAIRNNSSVLVWETATETRNRFFNVEHSTTGAGFEAVGRVDGNGTSATGYKYSFTHSKVEAGRHYYRLAQYDVDGRVTYSGVVALTAGASAQLQVYPNPAKHFISISSASSLEGSRYYITNEGGKQVSTGMIYNERVDVSKLAAGKYWVTVNSSNEGKLTASFMKQ